VLAIAALVAAAMATGILQPIEDGLSKARFAALARPASGQVTVVEIDARSLRAADRWPWSRDRYGQAIANLEAAGARTVAFDVDFSAPSFAEADRKFSEAIAAQPGAVVLPTFIQPVRDGTGGTRMVENSPLRSLASNALLASVNIPVDADGRVRRYLYGFSRSEGHRHSMAAQLADYPIQRDDTFIIDYSVKAQDIARISFNDVYENRFDPALVRGRSILIGATALELGDEFSTPQSGTMKGVYIHAIAFESLLAGRGLMSPGPVWILLLALGLAYLMRPTRPGATVQSLTRRHLVAAGTVTLAPLLVQAALPVSLPFAPLMLTQGLCLVWATRTELARRARAIVEEREAGLLHLALHDPETGLPNRRALLSHIEARLATAQAESESLAVLAIGIDRFQTMRGAVGYGQSSEIVRQVAARLSEHADGAVVAHLSTSVLGLVIRHPDSDCPEAVIGNLLSLDSVFVADGHPVDAHLKFGIARLCVADHEPEPLLEHASLALDIARKEDRQIVNFDAETYIDPEFNLALMSDMRRGLKDGQLSLFYQPKLTLADDSIHGAEALIRWEHPTRGSIRPDVFISIAEETGSIRELTEWTLQRALEDSELLSAGGHNLLLSVNISGRLLTDASFCDSVLLLIAGRDHRLCLEITETAVISNTASAAAAIAAFRAAGLKISIDDYGVGLSSLSYLKMLDAHELKIDKSLVESVGDSERDRLILKSTVDLAHGLGMAVVAEGVEDHALQDVLAGLGCDIIQGYLVSRAVPLREMERFVTAYGKARLAVAS
jgi:diguanylate cyclase